MKKEVLVKAAKELDKLLFKDPQIDFTQSPEKLVDSLMEASKELESDDELTKETIDVLGELWEGKDGKLTVEVCEIFQGLGILPLAKEDMREGPEDAIIVDSLVEEVEDAERLKDLKDIAKSNDEFKEIRGKLSGYKDVDALRGAMMEILDEAPEETEPEKVSEEKAAEPEYVQKMNKKKEEPKAKMEVVKGGKKEEKAKPLIKKGTGIIATIVSSIEKSGRKGISKGQILEKLVELFPDREEKSMKNTINVQVPNRITKEKFSVEKTKDGNYRKKA